MPDSSHEPTSEEYYGEAPISVSHLVGVIRRYSGVIVLSLASVAMAYLIIAAAVYLLSPRQKVVSMPFRLEFKGASGGTYPNGLKFSVADVVATPVLLEVYNANNLGRFVSFDPFSRSIYVLESNRELERLTTEYASKLADVKLTPVDRDRLEREFDAKRNSISKSEYMLQYVPAGSQSLPNAAVNKALSDILGVWARRAAVEKKALDYQVAVISPGAIDTVRVVDNDYIVPLLQLRQRLNDAITNARSVEEDVPGVRLIRLPASRLSISDIRARLDEVLRFRVEPLIVGAFKSGATTAAATEVARAQLAYDKRTLDAAQGRETALRNTLLTYESQRPAAREIAAGSATTQTAVPTTAAPRQSGGETVMPQLSDTFIDRIADLTSRNADRDYRQRLTNDIKDASLAVVPAQAAVKYDQDLLDLFQRGGGAAAQSPASLKQQWDTAVTEVRQAITDLNAIYTLASRQIYPETEMYRVTGPTVTRVDLSISPMRLLLYGILALFVALPLIIVFVFLHNRIREEEAAEEREQGDVRQRAATT
jgi:hypothetical protein